MELRKIDDRSRYDLAVGDDNDQVWLHPLDPLQGFRILPDPLGFAGGKSMSDGERFDGRRSELSSPTRRFIRLGYHQSDVIAGIQQCFKKGEGSGGTPEEDDFHRSRL